MTVISDKEREVLKDVSLLVEASSSAIMHGAVGSGKSAFQQMVLREIAPRAATVSVLSTDISYATQKPRLRN